MATSSHSSLERVTVNFVPRTSKALRLGTQLSGDSKTDVINRYVQIGAYIEWILSQPGGRIFVQEPGEKTPARLLFPTSGTSAAPSVSPFSEALSQAPADS